MWLPRFGPIWPSSSGEPPCQGSAGGALVVEVVRLDIEGVERRVPGRHRLLRRRARPRPGRTRPLCPARRRRRRARTGATCAPGRRSRPATRSRSGVTSAGSMRRLRRRGRPRRSQRSAAILRGHGTALSRTPARRGTRRRSLSRMLGLALERPDAASAAPARWRGSGASSPRRAKPAPRPGRPHRVHLELSTEKPEVVQPAQARPDRLAVARDAGPAPVVQLVPDGARSACGTDSADVDGGVHVLRPALVAPRDRPGRRRRSPRGCRGRTRAVRPRGRGCSSLVSASTRYAWIRSPSRRNSVLASEQSPQ